MYYSLHFFRVHNNNYSLDLCNRDLLRTIVLVTRTSLCTQQTISSEMPLRALSCLFISQGKQTDECRMFLPLRNVYKCKHDVSVIVFCVFCLRLPLQSCCCLFTSLSPFYTSPLFIFFKLLFLILGTPFPFL